MDDWNYHKNLRIKAIYRLYEVWPIFISITSFTLQGFFCLWYQMTEQTILALGGKRNAYPRFSILKYLYSMPLWREYSPKTQLCNGKRSRVTIYLYNSCWISLNIELFQISWQIFRWFRLKILSGTHMECIRDAGGLPSSWFKIIIYPYRAWYSVSDKRWSNFG